MNIKALITMLVLGSSSAALARPVAASGYAGASIVVRDHRAPRGYRDYRDHRVERAPAPAPLPAHEDSCGGPVSQPAPPPFIPVWTTLGAESRIIDGEMTFRVSPEVRSTQFSLLKLERAAGKSLIYRIVVERANGLVEVFELNQYLSSSTPIITVTLGAERSSLIRKVTVVGRNARQSAFNVLAI